MFERAWFIGLHCSKEKFAKQHQNKDFILLKFQNQFNQNSLIQKGHLLELFKEGTQVLIQQKKIDGFSKRDF